DSPRGIAVAPDGDVLIADTNNHRIQRYAPSGEFRLAFGRMGRGPGEFNVPSGIAVDPAGHVYVSDSWNHRVLKLTPSGREILAETQTGTVYAPFGIAISPEGEWFVAN